MSGGLKGKSPSAEVASKSPGESSVGRSFETLIDKSDATRQLAHDPQHFAYFFDKSTSLLIRSHEVV